MRPCNHALKSLAALCAGALLVGGVVVAVTLSVVLQPSVGPVETISAWHTGPTRGFHPAYAVDPKPYTSPVGAFPPNAYGLYDMAGNVSEWCADDLVTLDRNRADSSRLRKRAGNYWERKYAGSSWLIGAPVGDSDEETADFGNARLGFRTVRTPRTTAGPEKPERK